MLRIGSRIRSFGTALLFLSAFCLSSAAQTGPRCTAAIDNHRYVPGALRVGSLCRTFRACIRGISCRNSPARSNFDRDGKRPLPVILALMNDAEKTRYYVDPKTERVTGTYSNRNWVGRWLYNGLHSLNFPWLYKYRPLWDIVVITFMLGGTALSATSLVLAWRVLGRKLKRVAMKQKEDMVAAGSM